MDENNVVPMIRRDDIEKGLAVVDSAVAEFLAKLRGVEIACIRDGFEVIVKRAGSPSNV